MGEESKLHTGCEAGTSRVMATMKPGAPCPSYMCVNQNLVAYFILFLSSFFDFFLFLALVRLKTQSFF